MHSATCSIWSRKVKLKVSGKTGAIQGAANKAGLCQEHSPWLAQHLLRRSRRTQRDSPPDHDMVRPRIAARSPALHQRRSQEIAAVHEQKWNAIRSGQQYLNKIATQSAAFLYVIAVDGGEKGTKFKPTGSHRSCETTTAQFLDQDASGVSLQEKPVADRGGFEPPTP